MTEKDRNLVDELALNYSEIARILGVSRQTVRQGMQNEYKDYLDKARLSRLYEALRDTGDLPKAALLEPRLRDVREGAGGGASIAVLLGAGWTEMFCISAGLEFPRFCLGQLAGVGVGRGGELHLYTAQDPTPLEAICRGLPGRYRTELARWDVAACLPPLLYLDPGRPASAVVVVAEPQGRDFALIEIGGAALPGLQLGEGGCPGLRDSRLVESRAPLAGRELAQAKSGARRVFDFDMGHQGQYRLVMEQADDWGWLLRLECREPPASTVLLRLTDVTARQWLQAPSDGLTYQMIWPAGWPDPGKLANQGLFLESRGVDE